MGTSAGNGMCVGHVRKQVSLVSITGLPRMVAPAVAAGRQSSVFSNCISSGISRGNWGVVWDFSDYIRAHETVKASGKFNFQGCRIPIPTPIRYDRMREALGLNASPKELLVLSLLEFGFPINCNPSAGVSKIQKNHHSAVSFRSDIDSYINKNVRNNALLGPFKTSPIRNLRFSPLMSVPKEVSKRRVIVDFSFPPGRAINDGISKVTYLDYIINFSLPSVQAMVDRVNELGPGCHLYKRDLKGAFRQFSMDPGDYFFTGLCWDGSIYIDTRLAMGLRSASYCCQSVTELVAKIARSQAHVLVYLDDFGGAELEEVALSSFKHLGWVLDYCGLAEAPEKAVPPSTSMDWLGIHFNTVEWTMALKPGKLQELLSLLPKLLQRKRINKLLLQKVLGNLVWAAAVVRSGTVFFNRLLTLLRKLKRPNHSIYFSEEAKKDVAWWLKALEAFRGKAQIPPTVWTPLVSFATDASLEGFGMVWGQRALAGLFTLEFDHLDITKKEMLTVMAAVKHWFRDLANLKVRIFVDNQACVSLLNYGITKNAFLASCLREIQFVLAEHNIELKAQYIPSKENCLADLCSRAFTSDMYCRNFNKCLTEGTLILENILYKNFGFEHNL